MDIAIYTDHSQDKKKIIIMDHCYNGQMHPLYKYSGFQKCHALQKSEMIQGLKTSEI